MTPDTVQVVIYDAPEAPAASCACGCGGITATTNPTTPGRGQPGDADEGPGP